MGAVTRGGGGMLASPLSYETFFGNKAVAQYKPVDAATTDAAMPCDDRNQKTEISRDRAVA